MTAVPVLHHLPSPMDTAISTANVSLSAGTDKGALVFMVPESGDIDSIVWYTGAVTTGATLDVRLETVDSAGLPSGTLWAANTYGTTVVANTDDNIKITTALTANATVTAGQMMAVVWQVSSGTPSALQIGSAGPVTTTLEIPYQLKYVASWTKNLTPLNVVLHYTVAGYVRIPGCMPAVGVTTFNMNTGTTPDEAGNKITMPYTATAVGIWMYTSSTFRDIDLILYDSANSVLASMTLLGAHLASASVGLILVPIPEQTLSAGQVYRVICKSRDANSVTLHYLRIIDNAYLELGTSVVRTGRTDAGAWTDVSTELVAIGLVINSIDLGGGETVSQF